MTKLFKRHKEVFCGLILTLFTGLRADGRPCITCVFPLDVRVMFRKGCFDPSRNTQMQSFLLPICNTLCDYINVIVNSIVNNIYG